MDDDEDVPVTSMELEVRPQLVQRIDNKWVEKIKNVFSVEKPNSAENFP